MTDLIIVGAGLTGLVAAYTAVQAGFKVKIVAQGLGALHWSAGTIDVLGYYPDDSAAIQEPIPAIRDLARHAPDHPYAVLGDTAVVDALGAFVKATTEMGLAYIGAGSNLRNRWLPSPAGARRPTCLTPQSQIAGDLGKPDPMLVVGFSGTRDFYPELVAGNLAKQGICARAAWLPVDLITSRHDFTTVHLAIELDNPERRRALASELKKIVKPGERIGLPAILGLQSPSEAIHDLEAQTGAQVFEIPTLPPSVPGIRLSTALRKQVSRLGVRIDLNMNVIDVKTDADRVQWIETETSGRPLVHRADRFLLATGGILGGGIQSDHTGRLWDPVLNLPLAAPARRADWFRARFFDPAGHPVFGAGIPVNRDFQPVDAQGARVYANVWAAGTILAHADPILERSLEGIAVTTGIAAAQRACRTA